MKKLLSLMLSITIMVISIPCTFASESATESSNAGQIKNIIYLIPDGGGYAPYDFANMVKIAGGFNAEKFPNKTYTDKNPMSMRSQLAGSMTTAPAPGGVTDSAAAGTAMATGYKTINGFVGIDKNGIPKANLVEAAESVGKATGIISTYHWAHATPATFTAHASDRNDLYNIYQQIENKGLEVVLGVGYGQVAQYATIQNAIDNGYTVVETKEDLLNVKPGDKIWGNIDEKGIPYDIQLRETQANLAEMTAGAIEALSGDPDGFFLMVEGGKVDTGGHASNAVIMTSEYLSFDEAFKVALDFAKDRTDTAVICAPDHDTGGMIIPENTETAVAEVIDGTNPASVTWTTASHTDQNVGVWAYVPEGVSLIEGLNPVLGDTQSTRENYVIDNTDIAPWCADFMGVNLDTLSEELFVDVSTIGKYNYLTRKFTFNNGDKYVYSNQDEYYKDGVKIPTNGKTAMYINNAFYVPAEMVDEEDWNYITEWDPGDGITGTGSASDPYILDDAFDFMEFTANMYTGTNYSGKYIRQTKDIDLTPFSDYQGIGPGATFAGTYDGYGKKIIVNVTSDKDVSIFPDVTGVLMNVGTEGSITSTKSGGFASGIAYRVGSTRKIVNSYSNATVKASKAGGITTYTYGTIGNCSFCGTLKGGSVNIPIGYPKDDAYLFWQCYYIDGAGHTININIASDADECLFPYTTGTIINLGVTGSVKNASNAGAICRSVRDSGRLVNCWSNACVEGKNPGSLVSSNYGIIASCFFFGTLKATSGEAFDIARNVDGSVSLNNFYVGDEYVQSTSVSKVTNAQLKDEVTNWLNLGLSDTARATELPISFFSTWHYADGILSFSRDNTMTVDPDSLTVSLYGNTSIGTVYAVMYDADGKMSEVKKYPASETVNVKFDNAAEGSYAKIMWWHGDIYPMCADETIPL